MGIVTPLFGVQVRLSPAFRRGYVVRKPVAALGPGAGLSCWGWYLTAAAGPEVSPARTRASSAL